MARYIDADALIKKIFPYNVADKKQYAINAYAIYKAISEAPTADVVPKSEVIKEFAERLKKYYSHLDGKSPTPLIVYHIDQIEKEMLEGIKKGAADTHND